MTNQASHWRALLVLVLLRTVASFVVNIGRSHIQSPSYKFQLEAKVHKGDDSPSETVKIRQKSSRVVAPQSKGGTVSSPKLKPAVDITNEGDRDVMMREIIDELITRMRDLDGIDGTGSPGEDPTSDQAKIMNSIVRVYCTHSQPNYGMPWQRMKQEFSTSTGFVIHGNQILTNAHAVEYGSLIQVKKRQSEKKYVASVKAVAHECDLALLEIQDASFWEGLDPLEFGPIPGLQEDVAVIGYPVGGDSISISSGVVSRIEMQEYAQASAELLAIQIDAAINPGNSGGPVFNANNKVIGVAFQSLSDEDIENIGYVVPVNVVEHFLDDVKRHGRYSGVCGLGVRLQPMENDQLRKHFSMSADHTGVLVLSAAPTSPAAKLLKTGDVILELDGIAIANDGTIPFREDGFGFKERVQLSYYFTQKFAEDVVKLTVLRDGKILKIAAPLWVPQHLVPRTLLEKNVIDASTNAGTGSGGSIVGGVPSYLMIGGMVLLSLTKEYIAQEFHLDHMHDVTAWAEEFKILSLADGTCKEPGEEVVVLSQVIAHNCNVGYETSRNMQLKSFNGVPVKNLKQLKRMVDEAIKGKVAAQPETGSAKKQSSKKTARRDTSSESALVFEFMTGQIIVLSAQEALDAQDQICKEHFIPQFCSDDLIDI